MTMNKLIGKLKYTYLSLPFIASNCRCHVQPSPCCSFYSRCEVPGSSRGSRVKMELLLRFIHPLACCERFNRVDIFLLLLLVWRDSCNYLFMLCYTDRTIDFCYVINCEVLVQRYTWARAGSNNSEQLTKELVTTTRPKRIMHVITYL